jgi:hypothetical protein
VDKLGRNYSFLVQKKDSTTLEIKPPFTMEFEIHRNSFSSANVASFRIYNLAPNSRGQIRKDYLDTQDLRTLEFRAGYGKDLALAFKGNINQAWSIREGSNIITQIECFDGGFAYQNAITGDQFAGGTAQTDVIKKLVKSLPGVNPGAVGSFPGVISRGNSYSGPTTDILSDLANGGFFIDNGKAHCLGDGECLDGSIPTINAKSGLLGTPVLENKYVNLQMVFEPGIKIFQLVNIDSNTSDHFNGTYKVISIKHAGIISSSVAGAVVTSLGLLPGTFVPVREGS